MNNVLRIYFDTEFTGLRKDTDLISIGLITEDGNTFYAEFTDYDRTKLNSWIIKNVVKNLEHPYFNPDYENYRIEENRKLIQFHLMRWLEGVREGREVQFVSDCASYDTVLLFDLLTGGGTALDLPEWISPVVFDIVHLISGSLDMLSIGTELENNVSSQTYDYDMLCNIHKAFDFSREIIIDGWDLHIDGAKRNALYDAKVIKAICENLIEMWD